jgi:hypothetical protein
MQLLAAPALAGRHPDQPARRLLSPLRARSAGFTGARGYKEQVFLFTRDFTVDWTNNVSERGAKAAKRHQAVSGYWHSLAALARWCRHCPS